MTNIIHSVEVNIEYRGFFKVFFNAMDISEDVYKHIKHKKFEIASSCICFLWMQQSHNTEEVCC